MFAVDVSVNSYDITFILWNYERKTEDNKRSAENFTFYNTISRSGWYNKLCDNMSYILWQKKSDCWDLLYNSFSIL